MQNINNRYYDEIAFGEDLQTVHELGLFWT